MENLIQEYDIISIIISSISLAISFLVLIRDWWNERLKIKITVVKWFSSFVSNQPFFVWMVVQNCSKLPCSVIKMELEFKSHEHNIHAISHGNSTLVSTIISNDNSREIYSLDYPLILDGYQSVGGYIHFRSESNHSTFENKTMKLIVTTNSGKKKAKITLRFSDNVMRALQHKSGELKPTLDANGNPLSFTSEGL